MHLEPADKQAVSRGKRGCGPRRTELLFSPSAERGGEKRFVTHAGVAFSAFRTEFFSASGCSLLESFHLCHVPTSCLECMHEARLCIQASDCLHSGYIQSPMMQFNIRGERWSRLHCAYRMKCQAPSFSWCHRRGSMWMWDLSHMYIWIQKQSLLCWFSITKKVPSAFVCVCVRVCVFEMSFHDSRALCRSSYDFKAWAQVPSCERKFVFVLCAKSTIYNDLQRGTCFEGLHVSIFGS